MLLGLALSPCVASSRFDPRALFAAGEQGGWWDPSDFSTMFQDSAGTTPVTATGQPVGMIRDKSGRGNHRTQSTAASRPTLQLDASGYYYLSYDGVDDGLPTSAAVNFAGTEAVTQFAGLMKVSDTNTGMFIELSSNSSSTNGAFSLVAPYSAGVANYGGRSRGTTSADAVAVGFAAPHSAVLSHQGQISTNTSILRVNGSQAAASATVQGTGNYSSNIIYFGSRGGITNFFNGREYQTIIRGAASSAAQVAQAERFAGSKMGIAL